MNLMSADQSVMDRILDTAADNLRIAKILMQLGLDPDNVTYDAIFNRLLDLTLANITLANVCALIGAIFFVATLLTHSTGISPIPHGAPCTCTSRSPNWTGPSPAQYGRRTS